MDLQSQTWPAAVKRLPERSEVVDLMWVNHKAVYPYVDTQTWVTRYWLWRRRGEQAPPGPSDATHDRVAMILLRSARKAKAPEALRRHLEWHVFLRDDLHRDALQRKAGNASGLDDPSQMLL